MVLGSKSRVNLWLPVKFQLTIFSMLSGVASVRIRKASSREAGKYVCVARNLSGEAETVCKVRYVEKTTNKPPHFISPLNDLILSDGDDLQ